MPNFGQGEGPGGRFDDNGEVGAVHGSGVQGQVEGLGRGGGTAKASFALAARLGVPLFELSERILAVQPVIEHDIAGSAVLWSHDADAEQSGKSGEEQFGAVHADDEILLGGEAEQDGSGHPGPGFFGETLAGSELLVDHFGEPFSAEVGEAHALRGKPGHLAGAAAGFARDRDHRHCRASGSRASPA